MTHHLDALETFIGKCILRDEDDADAAEDLYRRMPDIVRGNFAEFMLRHNACGPAVRAALLKACWTDGNSVGLMRSLRIGLPTIVQYFQEAAPALFMDPDEQARLNALREPLIVYRGAWWAGSLRKAAAGLSWTHDLAEARAFAKRRRDPDDACVLQAEISREHILAWWTSSGRESEVVVDWRRLRKVRLFELWPAGVKEAA